MADIFRRRGPAWRESNAGHVSLGQLKVMSAIERCRTVALGGHVDRCEACAHLRISYNSCGNRHCPKCQAVAAKAWLAERQAELLPVPYFHVVFTLPATIADIAYQNKAIIYDLLFKAATQALIIIAADPKHLGARIGMTAVLHTWGSALTHHPHAHIIVPGGGISPDGQHWIACRSDFFLPVRVLSRLFRRLFLEKLAAAHDAGHLRFLGDHAGLAEPHAFKAYLAPLRRAEWVVFSKRPSTRKPFSPTCPATRIASPFLTAGSSPSTASVSPSSGKTIEPRARFGYKVMTVDADEFIRRFLIHVLPHGFHRIRHYGLFANGNRADNITRARQLLGAPEPAPLRDEGDSADGGKEDGEWKACPCCGGRMVVIETFERGCQPRNWPIQSIGIDSS